MLNFSKYLVFLVVLFLLVGCHLLKLASSRYPNSPMLLENAKQLDQTAIPLVAHLEQTSLELQRTEIWSPIGPNEIWARNVAIPNLLPVLPTKPSATGAAVLVIPGGGFQFISLANEGYPIAHWLAAKGIAAFVLKYRTMATPSDEEKFSEFLQQMFEHRENGVPFDRSEGLKLATSDARAAIHLIKSNNKEWNIDVERIGVLGFSAGAMTVMNLLSSPETATDIGFAGYLYGPMKKIKVPTDAPPLFVALARDDELFPAGDFGLIKSWIATEHPVEFHLYDGGSHGFGSKEKGLTSDLWIEQFYAWLKARKFIE